MNASIETLEFQAETRHLLRLVTHSIYSDKDIFLRELISNAADALDRIRLESYRDKDLNADTSDLHIKIDVNTELRTLTVRDNGIGMSRNEVVDVLGTIAKSGTAEFIEQVQNANDTEASANLIGQFGVGFYSSFIVADRVTLLTRRAGEENGTRWESTGEGTYTLETVEDAPQGTAVTLHLKEEDADDHLFDYTAKWKIREIVTRYSDFITWPIRMDVEHSEADGERTSEIATINSMKALWTRPREHVSDAEYHEFYKHLSHDWRSPLEVIHVHAEGTFEYQALLFIPTQAPSDLYMRDGARGLQLYVKRVHVMDACEEFMPQYLRFVKGVVDAQDLSLNVSREVLQRDRQIHLMRRRLVRKVLASIKAMMASDPDRYLAFWSEFGRVIKEGLLSDVENRELILDITSFASTYSTDCLTTLREYIERMKDDQKAIYYVTGESRSIIENSPHMEAFNAKGFEVLLLTDPIDEMWIASVPKFEYEPLQSITSGILDIYGDSDGEGSDETSESKSDESQPDFTELLSWMTETLQDEVKQVRLSSRLTTSPACLVADAGDITPTLEKMYRAMGREMPQIKRVLELNPTHPLVDGLQKARQERADDDPALAETAELLHGVALLAEGGELRDPSRFTRLLSNRLARTL